MTQTTLVLGASTNPERYAYRAIKQLREAGIPVIAVGKKKGEVFNVPITADIPTNQEIDTVTLYLNSENQAAYEEEILALRPRRIIFNPGTENESFAQKANKLGITTENACTLVMLSLGIYLPNN